MEEVMAIVISGLGLFGLAENFVGAAYPASWGCYRKTFSSRWMFAVAGLVAIVIALCTVSFQAIKTAVANPVKSLRAE
jgi:sugar phosphate permease